jgi:hypothetical protein
MSLDTSLYYVVESGEKPALFTYKPGPEDRASIPEYRRFSVAIGDARELLSELSLDEQGFELVLQDSAVKDFYDPEEVERVYFPEVERMVRVATGADRVIVFDHNVRCRELAKRGEKGAQEPVRVAHNDYTDRSGPQRVRDLVGGEEAEALVEKRFAVINVWRPIRGPVEATPLAVCDARSIADGDLVLADLVYRDRRGEVQLLRYSPNHRWFYVSAMQRREVLLIKCFDSERDGRARFTAHSAFDDPGSPPDAASRESIEVRTLAFFR